MNAFPSIPLFRLCSVEQNPLLITIRYHFTEMDYTCIIYTALCDEIFDLT